MLADDISSNSEHAIEEARPGPSVTLPRTFRNLAQHPPVHYRGPNNLANHRAIMLLS